MPPDSLDASPATLLRRFATPLLLVSILSAVLALVVLAFAVVHLAWPVLLVALIIVIACLTDILYWAGAHFDPSFALAWPRFEGTWETEIATSAMLVFDLAAGWAHGIEAPTVLLLLTIIGRAGARWGARRSLRRLRTLAEPRSGGHASWRPPDRR